MAETSLSLSVFQGCDSARTRKYLHHLEKQGQPGRIAASLFRSQKASSRAKVYAGGIIRSDGGFSSFRSLSFEKNSQSLQVLASLLREDSAGIRWGWGHDEETPHAPHVLYLDLPSGQVSFHSQERFAGPHYPGNWDGERASESRIIAYCDLFTDGLVLPAELPRQVRESDSYAGYDFWDD